VTGPPPPAGVERTLLGIESRVLEEVWISSGRFACGWVLVVVTMSTALSWFAETSLVSVGVPAVATTLLVGAASASAAALVARRFAWCCAAAYCCGLASVVGTGAVWWLRTGGPDAPLGWLIVADVAVVALTVAWLSVIVIPLERSQPDMRAASRRADGVSSSP
jgi:hypothetical protein